MEKEFVPYEQALALKELGFDEDCFKCKIIGAEHLDYTPSDYDDFPEQKEKEVLIPTFSQAFRWFREKHQIKVEPLMYIGDKTTYRIHNGDYNTPIFHTPEEAELECLKKLIEIVKRKK